MVNTLDSQSRDEGFNSLTEYSKGKTKIDWPSNEELLDRLTRSNYTKLARELGVSDNSIRKRLGLIKS